MRKAFLLPLTAVNLVFICPLTTYCQENKTELPQVTFSKEKGKLQIDIGGKPFATYIWQDPNITRPFFCHLHVLGNIQITRNHPPQKGDAQDHSTFHPGLWLAFADINGNDFWRLKARVVGGDFVQQPKGGSGKGTFAVRNKYLDAGGKIVCTEVCKYTILVRPRGYLLVWDSAFSSPQGDFSFGDQEEMGLGVRLATPIAVDKKRGGQIVDSAGRKNGKGIWGKIATWCDYSGMLEGNQVGVTLMPDPRNFRPAWWHARDYGLLVANPFGRNAFGQGKVSTVTVKKGDHFRLRFGIFLHATPAGKSLNLQAEYRQFLRMLAKE